MPFDQTVFRRPPAPANRPPALGQRLADSLGAAMASRAEIATERQRVDDLAVWRAPAEVQLGQLAQVPRAIEQLQRQVGGSDPQALGARVLAAERQLEGLKPVPVQIAALSGLPQQLRDVEAKIEGRLEHAFGRIEQIAGELDDLKRAAHGLHARLDGLEARIEACCRPHAASRAAEDPGAPARRRSKPQT